MKDRQSQPYRNIATGILVTVATLALVTQRWWGRSDQNTTTPVEIQQGGLPFQPSLRQKEPPDEDAPYLPNRNLTPGSVFQGATREEICVPGYSKRVRHVPAKVKTEVYRAYGIRHHQPGSYEMDHLISLELGGDNQPTNLWPEPYQGPWNAHIKDTLENELHQRVCSGVMPLQQAQREIAKDWVAADLKYLGGR